MSLTDKFNSFEIMKSKKKQLERNKKRLEEIKKTASSSVSVWKTFMTTTSLFLGTVGCGWVLHPILFSNTAPPQMKHTLIFIIGGILLILLTSGVLTKSEQERITEAREFLSYLEGEK